MSHHARRIRATRRETHVPGAPIVELLSITRPARCTGCGRDATLVAHRTGAADGALDVPWCSRPCRASAIGVSL